MKKLQEFQRNRKGLPTLRKKSQLSLKGPKYWTYKGFKRAIINMLKDLKKNTFKELKESTILTTNGESQQRDRGKKYI